LTIKPLTSVRGYLLGYRFGFRNCYDEAVARMIRENLNIFADGSVQVTTTIVNSDPTGAT